MNVLQLISSRLGYYGAERVVVTLSAALEPMGVHSVVTAFRNSGNATAGDITEKARERGLTTEEIVCTGRYDRQAVQSLRELVARHQIDVIHCHGIKPDLYALLAARQCKVALVSTCHLWVFENPKDWLISALERVLLHGFSEVVAVSDSIVPLLRHFGIRPRVVDNGIDLAPFRNVQTHFRERMGWDGRPIIGAIGRLAPQKGLPFLLRAAPEVLRRYPNALFVFAGDGPDRQALEAEADSLGIRDSVRFLGVLDNIPELLAAIDVLAMPSLSEGMPMALLEAMASGKAVVASRVGAIIKVINHRSNGLLIDSGDVSGLAAGIKEILKSDDLRQRLGSAAKQTIDARFSAEIMAQHYLEIYRHSATHGAGLNTDPELLRKASNA